MSAAVADVSTVFQSVLFHEDVVAALVDLVLLRWAYVQDTWRAPVPFHGKWRQRFVKAFVLQKCGANGWEMLSDHFSGRVVLCVAHWAIYQGGAGHVSTLVARQLRVIEV